MPGQLKLMISHVIIVKLFQFQNLINSTSLLPFLFSVGEPVIFTHTTLCIVRSLRQRRVCLSVRLSQLVLCLEEQKQDREMYTPSDSPMVLVSGKV